jgi:hypothetical protein
MDISKPFWTAPKGAQPSARGHGVPPPLDLLMLTYQGEHNIVYYVEEPFRGHLF